jgi:hypothetical protein
VAGFPSSRALACEVETVFGVASVSERARQLVDCHRQRDHRAGKRSNDHANQECIAMSFRASFHSDSPAALFRY